jgi:hypothetical protein
MGSLEQNDDGDDEEMISSWGSLGLASTPDVYPASCGFDTPALVEEFFLFFFFYSAPTTRFRAILFQIQSDGSIDPICDRWRKFPSLPKDLGLHDSASLRVSEWAPISRLVDPSTAHIQNRMH